MGYNGINLMNKMHLTGLFIGLLAAPLAAQDYAVDLPSDLAQIAVASALWLGPELALDGLVRKDCPCERSAVNSLDRPYAGRRNDQIATDSNSFVGLLALAPVSWLAIAPHDTLGDAIVIVKSLVVNGALNEVTKVSIQRPRPLLYGVEDGDAALQKPDNYLSFYSAHTSNVMAAGMSFAHAVNMRYPGSAVSIAAYAGAFVATAAVGTMRVQSGKHFPTDVLFGAAVGGVVGTVVPFMQNQAGPKHVRVFVVPYGLAMTMDVDGR